MDPLTAYAAAQTALTMIRKGVDFYKECKKAKADVSEITMEVSGWIGKFLDHKEVIAENARRAREESEKVPEPGKPVTLNSQALNNVMMQIQIENAEKELREMLIYQTPGLGAVWTKFEKERNRLIEAQRLAREAQEEQQRLDRLLAADKTRRRRQHIKKLWGELQWAITVFAIVCCYTGCIYLAVQERVNQYPNLGTCLIPRGSPGFEVYNNLRWVNCDE